MTGDKKKLKQIAIAVLIVLSLLVSSVSACVCSHHVEKTAFKTASCHEHSEKKQEANSSENVKNFDSNDECSCVQPAPGIFSKSETIKIEKQTSALPFSKIEIKRVLTVIFAKNTYFEKPFYLSDSFYNLKSPRAPPAA
jgi:hypothetical protein